MFEPLSAAPVGDDIALAIRGLVKIYGNLVAVADLSLDIPTGSFYGIVGPNGAGKTTTLTMATGLLTPDRGTALVHGVDVWQETDRARGLLGVMPDGMRLLDRLSGPDFLVHVAMLRGLDTDTARERSQELLTALDLAEAGKKLIADYSAGMTKKIALAGALIHSPRVLVAGTTDEVAQGGDLGERFTSLVGGVHAEEGLSWLGN